MVDQLEEIKRKIDIVQFISESVPLKKSGQNFKGLCPFHSEKTPSFVVSPERQIWHCFGACNEGGDIFRFLMKMENLEFGEALRELAKRAGVTLAAYKPTEGERQKQVLYEINHLAAEFFHFLLTSHPAGKKALNYILGRGISKDSLKRFKIGFAPNMWDGLQRYLIGKKGYRAEDLEKAGLIIKRDTKYEIRDTEDKRQNTSRVSRIAYHGYYDRFRNRLMFPLKDHHGNVCGFAGRILDPQVEEAKYVNTTETLIYRKSELLFGLSETKEEIKKAKEAVLVEGELDAISSYQAGVKNVVAIKGSALTVNQVQILLRFTRKITFALDSDIAGDQAAHRGIEIADKSGFSMMVVEIKGGKDPDEVAQKDPEGWKKMVAGAVPVFDYFLDSAFLKFDEKTAEGKREIGRELVPVLAKISDKIMQSHYIQLLAEKLAVPEEAIVAQIAKQETLGAVAGAGGTQTGGSPKSRREITEQHLLALCFASGNWLWLRKRKAGRLIETARLKRIAETLNEYLKRFKTVNSERFVKMLAPELAESFNQLYLYDLAEILNDDDKLEAEFAETTRQLEKISIKEKLNQLAAKIKTTEKPGAPSDKKNMDKLHEEFRDLTTRLSEIEEKR